MRSESVTTPTSELVENTAYWHSSDTESTEVEVTALVAGFIRAVQPEFVLETGSAFGQTTLAITSALRENGHGYLHSVDFTPERVADVNGKLEAAGLSAYGQVHQADASSWVPPEGTVFGFAWFDSDVATRYQEFHHYRQWMKSKTICGFHDMATYFEQAGGGQPRIELLVAEHMVNAIFLPTPRGVCFAEVL